jgi:DNA-binding transcriptional MerR regulator
VWRKYDNANQRATILGCLRNQALQCAPWSAVVHGLRGPKLRIESGCVTLAEYRLDDLARISGISARNIRAYRERGLLDPPRREGRSAFYDDYHVSQLRIINQLLRRGFTSAHITEFITGMRQGHNLADILGLQQAMLGRWGSHTGNEPQSVETSPNGRSAPASTVIVGLDPGSAEAQRLVEIGFARIADNAIVLFDPKVAEIVGRAPNKADYIDAILQLFDSTRDTIAELAAEVVDTLQECVMSRFGPSFNPKPEEIAELSRIVQDHRDLGGRVLALQLDDALHQHVVKAISDYTAQLIMRGQWESKTHS